MYTTFIGEDHCLARALKNIIDFNYSVLLNNNDIFTLKIDYSNGSLTTNLYDILYKFISNNCHCEKINLLDFDLKNTLLLAEITGDWLYYDSILAKIPHSTHFVNLEITNNEIYLIDDITPTGKRYNFLIEKIPNLHQLLNLMLVKKNYTEIKLETKTILRNIESFKEKNYSIESKIIFIDLIKQRNEITQVQIENFFSDGIYFTRKILVEVCNTRSNVKLLKELNQKLQILKLSMIKFLFSNTKQNIESLEKYYLDFINFDQYFFNNIEIKL